MKVALTIKNIKPVKSRIPIGHSTMALGELFRHSIRSDYATGVPQALICNGHCHVVLPFEWFEQDDIAEALEAWKDEANSTLLDFNFDGETSDESSDDK